MSSTSPYLKQHAHNPVFWYPWGKEALDRARAENKPILLSIGYSTCYWCHVMEREVFENLSIASLMNRVLINIKVDREEHPQLDEIYMAARQLMTHEGGWPNNVFLTPELKPFYAGGTYAPDDAYNRPAFPRLLDWLHYAWTTQEKEVRATADKVTEAMKPFLVYTPSQSAAARDDEKQAQQLFNLLKEHYDGRSGGFFQAPKFPHECFLNFLLGYYERTESVEALDMVTHSLSKMAAGGIYDHVGCGFHRYAVDKEWFMPHFEKMLYNQALLARLYTDAARLTGSPFLADVGKSVLDFVSGPLTSGNGAFYSGIDAETDGVEGVYYAWEPEELQALLFPPEIRFLTLFYSPADIPHFPGHKHAKGQVLVARKPMDAAAREKNIPYLELFAMNAHVMNRLLEVRNKRPSPRADDKIIVSWNGLMIDAFAHAGKVFSQPIYTQRAQKAARFLLEHAIDNEGELKRIIAGGRAQLHATLEDYAYLVKGLISLHRADPEGNWIESAGSLMERARELFSDEDKGYFYTRASERLLVRIKSSDDSMLPNANAVMLHNMIDLHEMTKDKVWHSRAQALAGYFLNGREKLSAEHATLMHAALRLMEGKIAAKPATFENAEDKGGKAAPDDIASVTAALFPANAAPGEACEVIVTLELKDGWHINANPASTSFLIATQVDVHGKDVELTNMVYPEALRKKIADSETLRVYEGLTHITAKLRLTGKGKKRQPLKVMVRFQPCFGTTCHKVQDISLTV